MTGKLQLDIKHTRIYIDTNVLWNYSRGQSAEIACLKLLFSERNRHPLFTSTFAIGQTMAGIQKSKSKKNGFSKEDTIKKGKYLISKINVLDFSLQDITNGFLHAGCDVEDNIHFAISEKVNCNVVITNDIAGYSELGIEVVTPKDLAYMKDVLQINK
jgi:predicted nucleic acid-binding protein